MVMGLGHALAARFRFVVGGTSGAHGDSPRILAPKFFVVPEVAHGHELDGIDITISVPIPAAIVAAVARLPTLAPSSSLGRVHKTSRFA